MTSTAAPMIEKSRLIKLPNGQLIGHPITRRELKRQLRQSRLQRRAEFREGVGNAKLQN